MGVNHVRVLSRLRNEDICEKIVICDVNGARLRSLEKTYDIDAVYTDIGNMFSREDLDGVVIAVPTIYHFSIAFKALDYCDVLIEKPVSDSLNNAYRLLDKSRRLDRIVAVGHIERFNPALSELKEYMNNMDDDKIIYISGQRIGPGSFGRKADNLGVAHDLMIHDIDIVKYLTNSLPYRVQAYAVRNSGFPYEVDISSTFFYKDFYVYLRASWRTSSTLKKRQLFIQTMNKTIELDYIMQSIVIEKGLLKHQSTGVFEDIVSMYNSRDRVKRRLLLGYASEPLYLEDKHFLNCISFHRKPLVDMVEGYIALKCIIKALESSNKMKPIDISWKELQ